MRARELYEREQQRIRDEPTSKRGASPAELREMSERERPFDPASPPTWHPGPRDFLANPNGDETDVILYAPAADLLAAPPQQQRNPTFEHPSLEMYGEWKQQLVRTALVRAEGYDGKRLPNVGSAEQIVRHCRHLTYADQEYLVTFALNGRNDLMAIHEVAIGTMHTTAAAPRDVLKVAFLTGAAAIIMVHNHPSGDPTPSVDDIRMTRAIRGALDCLGIPFLDHIVVAQDGWRSMMENV